MKKNLFSYSFFSLGFCLVSFFGLVALGGYVFVPISYPNAADLQLQQSLKAPGHQAYFLIEKREISFLDYWIHGKKSERLFVVDQENEVNPFMKVKFFETLGSLSFESMDEVNFSHEKYELKKVVKFLVLLLVQYGQYQPTY